MKRVEVVMTEEEHAAILAAAKDIGMKFATFLRVMALKAARG